MMRVLVIGGTGKVGVPLVSNLTRRGIDVTVLLHAAARANLVPPAAEAVVADLVGDPEGARTVFRGKECVFMLNKASLTETVEGAIAVQLAREAGVRRFVYQTVHLLEDLAYLPHVASKLAIKRAVELSGMEYTFLAPNHFFQNDEIVRAPLIDKSVYLTPLGSIGCWSVDARDIADAATIVLTSGGHAGKTYNIVGPAGLTGEEAAAVWTRVLGTKIKYLDEIEAWQGCVRQWLSAWLYYDLSLMYRHFARRGMLATARDVEQLTELLGRPPRSLEDYAAERVREWLVEG